MPKVSVIIPVYNVSSYLEESINSLLSQSMPDFEAIFVDDGSSDGSLDVLRKFSTLDHRIKVFSQINAGSGAARNKGLDQARGEYIYFMDPDDWIEQDLLKDNIGLIDERRCDMIVFGHVEKQSNRQDFAITIPTPYYFSRQDQVAKNYFLLLKFRSATLLWNKIYRRELLTRSGVRFTTQRTGQDSVFNFTLAKYLNSFSVNPRIYYNYRKFRPNSAQTTIDLGKLKDDANTIFQLRELYDFWAVKDRGALNSRVAHTIYATYQLSAVNAIMRAGLSDFFENNRGFDFSELRKCMNSNGFLAWKGRVKMFLGYVPVAIYFQEVLTRARRGTVRG